MEEGQLKKRLVGAVVLIALAVIFIPMLLGGGQKMEMPVFGSNVPERSEQIKNMKHLDISKTKQNTNQQAQPKSIPIAPNMVEPKLPKVAKKTSSVDTLATLTKSNTKQKSTVHVWAVQVGSFGKKQNALSLKEKLRKKKRHAFVERLVKNNKAVYRVRVGPVSSEKKAKSLKKKLKAEFKLDGLIVRHP
ncbi:MAG: SPOR domain-containing protein [Woeseiaceae bacterium]